MAEEEDGDFNYLQDEEEEDEEEERRFDRTTQIPSLCRHSFFFLSFF